MAKLKDKIPSGSPQINRLVNYQKHAVDLKYDPGNNGLFDPMGDWRHYPIYDWHPLNFWYDPMKNEL